MKVRHVRRDCRTESHEGVRRVCATLQVRVTADVQSVHRAQHRRQICHGKLTTKPEAREVKVSEFARRVAQ